MMSVVALYHHSPQLKSTYEAYEKRGTHSSERSIPCFLHPVQQINFMTSPRVFKTLANWHELGGVDNARRTIVESQIDYADHHPLHNVSIWSWDIGIWFYLLRMRKVAAELETLCKRTSRYKRWNTYPNKRRNADKILKPSKDRTCRIRESHESQADEKAYGEYSNVWDLMRSVNLLKLQSLGWFLLQVVEWRQVKQLLTTHCAKLVLVKIIARTKEGATCLLRFVRRNIFGACPSRAMP